MFDSLVKKKQTNSNPSSLALIPVRNPNIRLVLLELLATP